MEGCSRSWRAHIWGALVGELEDLARPWRWHVAKAHSKHACLHDVVGILHRDVSALRVLLNYVQSLVHVLVHHAHHLVTLQDFLRHLHVLCGFVFDVASLGMLHCIQPGDYGCEGVTV